VQIEIDTHPSPVSPGAERETALIKVVGELLQELHPQWAKVADVLRSGRLERDLGIDSLAGPNSSCASSEPFAHASPVWIIRIASIPVRQ
jgi:hypothetical protein